MPMHRFQRAAIALFAATLGFATPAKLTAAERHEWDSINGDRIAAHVGVLRSSAVLERIARLRVRQMAARHSDYAGYDVGVNIRNTHLCSRGSREIEGESTAGTDFPAYAQIQLGRDWTAFADASYTSDGTTYTVQDYLQACNEQPAKPITLPHAHLTLTGIAVSVGPPSAGSALPLGSRITDTTACNPQADLWAVVRYAGPRGVLAGEALAAGSIRQFQAHITPGTHAIRLAGDLAAGGSYGFLLSFDDVIRLPDGDRIYEALPGSTVGSKLAATVAPDCTT